MLSDYSLSRRKIPLSSPERFSILIPSWNNLSYLQLCINSIRKNSDFAHQIIVHVNDGKDGTLQWVSEQPDLDYSHTSSNAGVCYALNIARSLVRTDYILYMNDDMYACPGWDKELNKEIAVIGHKFFFLSSTAIEPHASSNCAIGMDFGRNPQEFREKELLDHFSTLPKSDWQGATWPPNIVHRDIWDIVGGYSTEFSPGMYSDPDFSMKLWNVGVRLFKGLASSRVYHFGSVSVRRHEAKNKGYYTFISKWGFTSSLLTKHILRRGEPFDGPLKEPSGQSSLKLKNFFKRVSASFVNLKTN